MKSKELYKPIHCFWYKMTDFQCTYITMLFLFGFVLLINLNITNKKIVVYNRFKRKVERFLLRNTAIHVELFFTNRSFKRI